MVKIVRDNRKIGIYIKKAAATAAAFRKVAGNNGN